MRFSTNLVISVLCFVKMMQSDCADWEFIPNEQQSQISTSRSMKTRQSIDRDNFYPMFETDFGWLEADGNDDSDDDNSDVVQEYKRDTESNRRRWSSTTFDHNNHLERVARFKTSKMKLERDELCQRNRDMEIACFCLPDNRSSPIESVDCWILSPNVHSESKSWNKFQLAKTIDTASITVQQMGYMNYIPTKIFKLLPNLQTFTIRHADVDRIEADIFSELKLLKLIEISDSNIEILDENAFRNFRHLRDLNLPGNKINDIELDALKNLPALEQLILRDNLLTELKEGQLQNVNSLLFLDLSYNLIRSISTGCFQGLGKLEFLRLDSNRLIQIDDETFVELWCLLELNLDNNNISRISNRAFDGLNKLRTLSLRNNKLRTLGDGIFRGTATLNNVFLQNNTLESLSFETFLPMLANLNKNAGAIHVAGNSLICDCNMQWILQMKGDYASEIYPELLRKTFDDFVCKLKRPKITDFKAPIPVDIINMIANYQENRENAYYDSGDGDLFQLIDEEARNDTKLGMVVPFFSLRKEALICEPEHDVLETEMPLADVNGSSCYLLQTTILPLSITAFLMIVWGLYGKVGNCFYSCF